MSNDHHQNFLAEYNDMEDNSDDSGTDGGGHKSCAPLREQDRFLPIANVAKIMKKAIPDNGKIAKDARECVQECVSEFISFITSEASERCHTEKRKTINGEDILFAMNALGFENYVEPLKMYLLKYRDNAKPDKNLATSDIFEVVSVNDTYPTQSVPPMLQQGTIDLNQHTLPSDAIYYFNVPK